MNRARRFALATVLSVGFVCTLALVAFTRREGRELASRGPQPASPPHAETTTKFIDTGPIDDGGFRVAARFTGPIHDATSLAELRAAVDVRGRLGIAVLQAEVDGFTLGFRAPREAIARAALLRHQLGLLNLYEGRFTEASLWFQQAQDLGRPGDVPVRDRAERNALLGLAALRRGEVETGPKEARSAAVREAVVQFQRYLEQWPGDLRVRWLLNVAYRTIGEYPAGVPEKYLISLDQFRSKIDVGAFEEVAQRVGLHSGGPGLAGGSVFDDLDGDRFPDLFITSLDTRKVASLHVNRGDRTFVDRSRSAGLEDQVYAINVTRADIDNDGDLDLLLVRGACEGPFRPSLLCNKSGGVFEDVTVASGLGEPVASGSAAWGDFDNDGWVDVFICEEGEPAPVLDSPSTARDRKRSRLYRNQGDGTFVDVASAAGVTNDHTARGAAWGDYDDDGRLDLFVSNVDAACRLYRNLGDGAFHDVTLESEVAGPAHNSSTFCWFWDFDNDGRIDLFVNDAHATLADVVGSYLGRTAGDSGHPRLYRNQGSGRFRDVSREVGLDRPVIASGANFGDIDNDGFLDIYLAPGGRSLASPTPSLLLKNVDGRRFQDVTESSHTREFQKGSAVSFADANSDGQLDFIVCSGGSVPGDRSFLRMFQNPGHGGHWLKVKLTGTRTNRAALGARIKVDVNSADGRPRSIYRTVGHNSSSGGNSLVESFGLASASTIDKLTVSWPISHQVQEFANIHADQEIEITEGAASYQVRNRPGFKPAQP